MCSLFSVILSGHDFVTDKDPRGISKKKCQCKTYVSCALLIDISSVNGFSQRWDLQRDIHRKLDNFKNWDLNPHPWVNM